MNGGERAWTGRLKVRLRLNEGEMSMLGSERSFDMPIGSNWMGEERLGGYYIDFRNKCSAPDWPPYWLGMKPEFYVATTQWALGALERYLEGEGEQWLEGARGAADYLLDHQEADGPQKGGWVHLVPMPHSYRVDPPWVSSITQGEGASLLARIYEQTGDERYAEAALRALKPMGVPVVEGGALASIDGVPFVEEYPTSRPSAVLNGAIFALWGFNDVARGLDDDGAGARFESLVEGLISILDRFDTGYWSLYDLYPHPVPNVASPAYHALHIKQLEVLNQLSPHTALEEKARRFAAYRASPAKRASAVARKVGFRLLVPRNPLLASRLPWNRAAWSPSRPARHADILVLGYHAVSPGWPARLSVSPERLEEQLSHLAKMGYRGVTFSEAVRGTQSGKLVAITFDDGYRSVYELARPILDRFGWPGTVFVPTEFMDRDQPMAWPGIDQWLGGEHEHELTPLSWDQARELVDAGWEIGSHTMTHPHLTEVSDEEIAEQLAGSRETLEKVLHVPCESIAFPYGDYDARVVAATAVAGYSAAATLPSEFSEPQPLSWPRIGVYNDDNPRTFRLKVSPTVLKLRGSRAWLPLMALRRKLTGRTPEA